MVRFYDPIDGADQQRIEQVLRKGRIEYFLRDEAEPRLGSSQILVAEEDIPEAEIVLDRALHW